MINPNPTPSVRMRTTKLVIRLTVAAPFVPTLSGRVGSNRFRHVRPLQVEKRETPRSIQKRVDKNTADVMLR